MRSSIFSTAAVVFATAILALPAQAAPYHRHNAPHARIFGSGGFGNGPYWQGTAMGHGAIWRNGYYQGNDPDPGIRFDLMRDGRNYAH
jgi:hypothetical protein